MGFIDANYSIAGDSKALDGDDVSTEQEQVIQRTLQEQALIYQLIIIKHLEIITDNIITEQDLQ